MPLRVNENQMNKTYILTLVNKLLTFLDVPPRSIVRRSPADQLGSLL
jgi:hypothetical protein